MMVDTVGEQNEDGATDLGSMMTMLEALQYLD